MHKIILLSFLVFVSLIASAQNDLKEQMNAIKLDSTYYWSEATSENRESATNDALIQMASLLSTYNISKTESELKTIAQFLYIPRGERIRAFVYVKKDVFLADNSVNSSANNTDNVSVNVSVNTNNTNSNLVAETSLNVQQNVSNQPVSQQTTSNQTNVQQTFSQQTMVTSASSVGTSVLMTLAQCEQITDASRCLRDFKRDGLITDYGKITNREQLSENNYLLIFDNELTIKAILAPPNSAGRKNISTGETDSITGYSGYGVMWFK